jgi:hypothetical protein
MKQNMGTIDRVGRILIAVVVAVLYFTGVIGGPLAIILGIVALAFILTGFVGTCPLYMPFGFSTRPRARA